MATQEEIQKKLREVKEMRRGLGDLIANLIMYNGMRGEGEDYEENSGCEDSYQSAIQDINKREQELDERIRQLERKDVRY